MSDETRPWLIDVPVAVNFFTRPDEFQEVFNVLKRVRPRQLFLISDGPRSGNQEDIINVAKCREIAKDIDWVCEIYRYYNDENKGLFDTYFTWMKEVFQIVDRCIFLEDDLVPSDSFFYFCKDLLEKYEHDLRIHFITGVNYLGEYSRPSADYFFSGEGSITGYALWKRTFDSMSLDFLADEYVVSCAKDVAKQIKPGYERRIEKTRQNPLWEGHVPHVEFYKNVLRMTQGQLYIVPSKNLITVGGVSGNATHSADGLNKLPRVTQKIFYQERFELNFPLKHPKYVVRDLQYERYVNYLLAWHMPIRSFARRVEALIRHLACGDFKRVGEKLLSIGKTDSRK